jgi:molybdenum cofactor cytidylyltransferase
MDARSADAVAVISKWRGRRSPPVLLGRALFPAIDALTGDVGARDLLAGRGDVVEVEVTLELGSLADVDRPEDLDAVD